MQNYTWAVGILPYRNTALHFSLICPGIETYLGIDPILEEQIFKNLQLLSKQILIPCVQ